MEAFLIVVLALGVIFGPWVALIVAFNRHREERQLLESQLGDLTRRVQSLERDSTPRPAPTPAENAPTPVPIRVTVKPPAEIVYARPSAPEPPPELVPEPVIVTELPESPVPEPTPELPETPVHVPPPPPPPEPRRRAFDIEETLGADWLNKLGVVILVVGIALFLAYQLRQVGPLGKVLTGLAVSGVLLVGGILLEKRENFRIIGRAGVGGGWALAFFVSYAMYHVEATKVFDSQLPDLYLMLVVAAGMVLHTLRYRSQVVTGLAFLLAFATLTVSQVTVYSLVAEIILAVGLTVIVGRMRWFALELFGIAAAYLNHWWWVRRIIEPMGEHRHSFPEFFPSAAILLAYWAIFRVSYILRSCDEGEERLSAIAALLNSFGLLVLLKYQSIHPEWAFRALLALGVAELVLALLPATRRRRPAFLMLATIGVSLFFSAAAFRFQGKALDSIWLIEAEVLLGAGIIVREVLYRRLGLIASAVAALHVVGWTLLPLAQHRFEKHTEVPDFQVGALCLVAALLFYANAHVVLRRWATLFESDAEQMAMRGLSFPGSFFLLVAIWAASPGMRMAPGWAIAGAILLFIGSRSRIPELVGGAHFFFASSIAAALVVNLSVDPAVGGTLELWLTVSIIAALLYAVSRWSLPGEEMNLSLPESTPAIYRWAGTSLLLLLTYLGLEAASISPAWVVLGLLLLEAGFYTTLQDLRFQGYLSLFFAFAAIFFVNLNADFSSSFPSARLATCLPVVLALYYVHVRLEKSGSYVEKRLRIETLAGWGGAIAAAALLRFELSPDWVSAAWAACALVLLGVALLLSRRAYLHQALFFCLTAAARASLHSLYQRSNLPGPFWSSRAVCTSATALILLAGLAIAFRLRNNDPAPQSSNRLFQLLSACGRRPEQVFFFAPLVLVVALLAAELPGGMITISWSGLGVLVFLFALWVRERSFRLAGLILLLLGVGKIGVVDVWQLSPRDRYLTLISMGSALLLVSFLYSKYREIIRRYL